ncbi:hypothetical protein DFJ43DRAFT_1087804 [Lentinula guzmanii]|uniref:Zinc-ribbon 15 domain-containing protein n=1 Tax=Lentinula guzmanii TaxID=2804957 RepID=A0AA38JF90_9AGAR|nr:hypothetical protein DFJ43DRAFT_1087804 [Lentinula guzmanii]
MFFFLPLIFGCPTKVKPDGNEQTAHFCPRCNNASVYSAKSRTWFEFFFVPLIPMKTKHIWMCGICRWTAPLGPGCVQKFSSNTVVDVQDHSQWEPPIAYQNHPQSSGQGYTSSGGYGHQPPYNQPSHNSHPNQK